MSARTKKNHPQRNLGLSRYAQPVSQKANKPLIEPVTRKYVIRTSSPWYLQAKDESTHNFVR